jgi:hypothetical protein
VNAALGHGGLPSLVMMGHVPTTHDGSRSPVTLDDRSLRDFRRAVNEIREPRRIGECSGSWREKFEISVRELALVKESFKDG